MNRIHKFRHLNAENRRLLVGAACLLGALRFGIWLLPFPVFLRLVGRLSNSRFHSQCADPRDPGPVVRAVTVAGRYVPRTTCLTLALAVQILLARRACPAQLCIGVAKTEDGLEAHAWVESHKRIVAGGTEGNRYHTLVSFERLDR